MRAAREPGMKYKRVVDCVRELSFSGGVLRVWREKLECGHEREHYAKPPYPAKKRRCIECEIAARKAKEGAL